MKCTSELLPQIAALDFPIVMILRNELLQSNFLVNVLPKDFQGKFKVFLSGLLQLLRGHSLVNLCSYVSLEMTFCWRSLPTSYSTIGYVRYWKKLSVVQKRHIFNDAALRTSMKLLSHRSKARRELLVLESFEFRPCLTVGFPNLLWRHSTSRYFTRNKKALQDQLSTAVSPGMWLFTQSCCRPHVMLWLV